MSWPAFEAVKHRSQQRPAPKLVLSYIAHDLYDKDDGIARLTYREMMDTTGVTERFLRSVIGGLVRAGELIVWVRPGDPRGNTYAIPLYPGEVGYQPPATCDRADGHYCNGFHAPALVNREKLIKEQGDDRATIDRKRANRAKQEYYAQPATRRPVPTPAPAPTARRPGRRAEPDAAGVPDSADVTPAPSGLVYPAPRSGDAGPEQPTADILTPDGRLTPEEQQRRERANLAALGLTDADAEEYRANPRDWRAAHGIRPRPGAGHTRPAAQPGRSPSRR